MMAVPHRPEGNSRLLGPFRLLADNPIVIGAGPLVGTPVPGAGKAGGTTRFALQAEKCATWPSTASPKNGNAHQRLGEGYRL